MEEKKETEVKYATKADLNEKHLFEKDVEIEYDSDGKGTMKKLLFRIKQMDVNEHEESQSAATKEGLKTDERLRAMNDGLIAEGVVKPVMDGTMINNLRTNFPAGVYDHLLEEIQYYSGFHAMQMVAAKNMVAPKSQ